MKNFKFVIVSALMLNIFTYNSANASNNGFWFFENYCNYEPITDDQILYYLNQEGNTVNSAIKELSWDPDITRDRVINIYKNSSYLINDICYATQNTTVYDIPSNCVGFLNTIKYCLKQCNCEYSDKDVRKAIRKLYY